jgi:hypothetical protein
VKKYFIDSYAIMAYFENEPGAKIVVSSLNDIMRRKIKTYMSKY